MKNYDHVSSQDYEKYFEKGIINWWATVNILEDQKLLNELSDKHDYVMMSTAWINVQEMAKRGATLTDVVNQQKELEGGEE